MSRWVFVLVVLGLVIAACAGGDAADSTTSTTRTSTTTTTVATTTTTEASVEACEPTPLEGQPRVWEEGCMYTADSFAVPVAFSPPGPGWTSQGSADRWIELRYDADLDGSFDVSLTLVIYEADSNLNEVAETLIAIEGVDLVAGPDETTIGPNPSLVLDLLGQEDYTAVENEEPCTDPRGTARFFGVGSGYPLFYLPELPSRQRFGIPACFATRAWVIDLVGTSVTALGVVKDNEQFDDLMPILEDFLDNNVTFGENSG